MLVKHWFARNKREATIAYFNQMKHLDDFHYVLCLLQYYTAPTAFGNKTGTMVNLVSADRDVSSCWNRYKWEFEKRLSLSFIELKSSEEAVLLYFYNPITLEKRLKQKKAIQFLEKMGYGACKTLTEYMQHLQNRFAQSKNCPNEVGIFLGYPVTDVEAFHSQRGECKCSGYWKCYNRVFLSKCKFIVYDLSKFVVTQKFRISM